MAWSWPVPAEPSQIVDAGTPVLIVGDAGSGYVLRLPVADRDAARLRLGAPARVRIAALGDAQITGSILQIGGRADQATGTFEVEGSLAAAGRAAIRPGGQR